MANNSSQIVLEDRSKYRDLFCQVLEKRVVESGRELETVKSW